MPLTQPAPPPPTTLCCSHCGATAFSISPTCSRPLQTGLAVSSENRNPVTASSPSTRPSSPDPLSLQVPPPFLLTAKGAVQPQLLGRCTPAGPLGASSSPAAPPPPDCAWHSSPPNRPPGGPLLPPTHPGAPPPPAGSPLSAETARAGPHPRLPNPRPPGKGCSSFTPNQPGKKRSTKLRSRRPCPIASPRVQPSQPLLALLGERGPPPLKPGARTGTRGQLALTWHLFLNIFTEVSVAGHQPRISNVHTES